MAETIGITLPHTQLKSLTMGKGVNMKPDHLKGNEYKITLMPDNMKKIRKMLKTGKGARITLTEEEDITNKEGGSLKGLRRLGKRIKKGANKAVKKVGKSKGLIEIEKGLLTAGTEVLLPAAAAALTSEMGPVASLGAASAAKILGDKLNEAGQKQIDKQKGGRIKKAKVVRIDEQMGGRIKKAKVLKMDEQMGGKIKAAKVLKKVGKVAKKVVKSKEFKQVAKSALSVAAETAGQAVTLKTGDSRLGDSVSKTLKSSGNTLIETGSVKKGLKSGSDTAMKEATDKAVEMVDDMIEEKFGKNSNITTSVETGLSARFPAQSALVDDTMDITTGSGLFSSRRHQAIKFMPKGRMVMPMGKKMGGQIRQHHADGMQTLVDGPIGAVRTIPGATVQTGSPFNRMNSPSNYPFIPSSPQLMDAVSRGRMGGSMYPSGRSSSRSGGSMYPSGSSYGGRMCGGSMYPAGRRRMRGGSFLPA